MSAHVHYQIALEFDFPEKLVRCALRKYTFKDAGSFVDYLETHKEELEAEVKKEEEEEEKKKKEEEAPPEKREGRELSLLEETWWLYRKARCKACKKNRRSVVTLPCCHYSLCETCERTTKQCPICQEIITGVIRTYD